MLTLQQSKVWRIVMPTRMLHKQSIGLWSYASLRGVIS